LQSLPDFSLEDNFLEAQTDIQTYMERGKQALAEGQGREAAIAYAHAAQLEPDNPLVHLGLAEANLALGSYGVVYMACRKVQELQPAGGVESTLAQAMLNLLDRRYDRALQDVDAVISQDPGAGYVHALRAYLLRASGQDYDAGLARARAARLSHGMHFDNCFPPLEPISPPGYAAMPTPANGSTSPPEVNGSSQRETIPTWSRPNNMQRQVIRTRFAISQNPRFVTSILIGINLIVFVILCLVNQTIDFSQSAQSLLAIVNAGAQVNLYVQQGQVWRIFTAMFLHFSILHIALNMLSLFFIGTVVEVFFGKWRYLVIYLGSGILGGIFVYFMDPSGTVVNAGASGAIFGVFGALGVFYFVNRRNLGAYGRGAITNWLFWLGLNLFFGFSASNIGIWDHIAGLVAGMLLAILLIPRTGRRQL
jgi:membrane associated rhomboid family serine protease